MNAKEGIRVTYLPENAAGVEFRGVRKICPTQERNRTDSKEESADIHPF